MVVVALVAPMQAAGQEVAARIGAVAARNHPGSGISGMAFLGV